ncbi:MAG: ATP-binding protein [Candidatus Methanomethylicia archaeon]
MSIPFYNREIELSILREALSSERAELIIIYGRRRIGKTVLSRKLLEKYPGTYIYVEGSSIQRFLIDASNVMSKTFHSIDDFLDYVFLEFGSENRLLVLDEYQRISRKLSPRIQYHWDASSGKSKVKLLLLGSTIGMVERDISYLGPLYGRSTRIIRMDGFDYKTVREIFGGREEDNVKIYSILGGTPHYLMLYDKSRTLEENIRSLFLKPGAPLYEEVERLLAAELRDPSRYLEILEAISMGKATLKEISDYTGLERHKLKKYLLILEKLMLIERETSILRKDIPRYGFKDNFFQFYMRFIHPNTLNIELRQEEYVLNKIIKELQSYIGKIFEKICLSILSKTLQGYKVGTYWDREGNEVDVVAIGNEKTIFFECKTGRIDSSDVIKFKGKVDILASKLNLKNPQSYFVVPEKSEEEIEGIKILELKQLISQNSLII